MPEQRTLKICQRCSKPIPPEERRHVYCSDACANSALRDRIKVLKARSRAWPKRLYRYYPKVEQ